MAHGIQVGWCASPRSQGGRWQFSSSTLCLAEKIAQTNKNARYVLQNSRGRKLAVKRTRIVLKVGLPRWHTSSWSKLVPPCAWPPHVPQEPIPLASTTAQKRPKQGARAAVLEQQDRAFPLITDVYRPHLFITAAQTLALVDTALLPTCHSCWLLFVFKYCLPSTPASVLKTVQFTKIPTWIMEPKYFNFTEEELAEEHLMLVEE